ncbi:MAG TPA: acetylornithine transaminase [Gemmatimonadaceae bacterium]|nr:acetylornithine transaminase [Gemmatimonadaceae bacterium]
MTTLTLPVLEHAPGKASAILGTYKRAPLEIVGGRGVELLGADGRTYLDFASGIGVNALGYGDEGLRGAIAAAADTGVLHSSNLYATEPGETLAQRLVDKSFASSVFFCNSGAEANEGAFKFARRWARTVGGPRKHEIVALRGGFHGRLFASLAATDRPAYRAPFRPLAPGISICERSLDDLAHMLDADTVAAVIVEPVQGEGGVRVIDAELLAGLRQLTSEREIALIFDEVQCGLGRTGTLFAYEHSGVVPDMLTLAKPLAGGLPMGAVLLSDEVARAIQPGDHATTFGGGPFVASVALHVFDRLSDESLLRRVRENGAWLESRLSELCAGSRRVRAVRGMGYMWGIDVVESASDVVSRALEAGLLILSAGDYTLRLLPPLVAGREELGAGLAILEGVVS